METRAAEIALASVALAFWFPTMLVIYLALIIAGARPPIRSSQHVTADGRLVRSIRFHTDGTRIGRLVRPNGLDALPQYFDVVRGRLRLGDIDRRLLPGRPD